MTEIEFANLGKCHKCKTRIYEDEVFEFENVLYCSLQCILDDLLDEKAIINLSK